MTPFLRNLFRKSEPAAAPAKEKKAKMVISSRVLTPRGGDVAPQKAFALPAAAPGVIPRDAKMACDSAMGDAYAYAMQGAMSEGLGFMGYPYLAELTQRPEYRRPAEILAKEMTRKWIKLQVTGEDDKGDKLKVIEAELKRLNAQDAFRRAAEQDGFFGRAQIYLDMGNTSPEELRTPLADSVAKVGKDGLKRLVVVEPVWTYPNQYNSTKPLAADFFKPQSWFVQGQQIHASRLLTIVSREVPDLLKPAYAFGGLSLSQIAKPYVDNWLRTRQSVSDLLHSFSTNGLKTNLTGALNGGAGDSEYARMSLFNANRDNQGLLVIDKDTEEFFNVSAPLGSLDKLQAQSQEHMAAVTGIPLVVLLGITPSGLNASSDGEVRTFYAWIEAQQEDVFRRPLERILSIIQLAKFGEIDPEIGFRFEPLWSLDEAAAATVRKTNAETGQILITAGVIDTDEERARLAGEEDSPYAGLDLNKEIVAPNQGGEEGEDSDGAMDADFEEGKHPRADSGKFGAGGGATGETVTLKGDELGSFSTMKELREKAMAHATRFIGKTFTNRATGNEILVPKSGVKHTIAGAQDSLVRTVPAIPDLLEKSQLVSEEPDDGAGANSSIETYSAPLSIEGRQFNAILTVKVTRDGRRYYDHGIVE